jgi:DNA mismatch endonuclease Vsr
MHKRLEGPWPDVPEARRRTMRANKATNTGPEMEVRRMLHAMGYRFRLHRRSLPGCPDLVFPARKAAIQVHGCFWHQHSGCRHAHLPKARVGYWGPKLARTVERDRENERRLGQIGWRVLVVWECALVDREAVSQATREFLGPPGSQEAGEARSSHEATQAEKRSMISARPHNLGAVR